MPDQVGCSCCLKLKLQIEELTSELEDSRETVRTTEDKLSRMQKLFEMANKFAEELKVEVLKLNEEIRQMKKGKTSITDNCDVAVQTDLLSDTDDSKWSQWRTNGTIDSFVSTCQEIQHGEEGEIVSKASDPVSDKNEQLIDLELHSAWLKSTHNDPEEGEIEQEETQSIADSIREAAEAAQKQTEFVFDEGTGLYYDKTSGYYYDAERCLYYEPYSGVYYKYNVESKTYEYHSRVDFSQYSEDMYKRYYQNVTGEKGHRKEVKSKKKKKHRTKEDEQKERKRKNEVNSNTYTRDEGKKLKTEPDCKKEYVLTDENCSDAERMTQIKMESDLESDVDDSYKMCHVGISLAECVDDSGSRSPRFVSEPIQVPDYNQTNFALESALHSSSLDDVTVINPPVPDEIRKRLDTDQMSRELSGFDHEEGEITSSSSSSQEQSAESETDSSSVEDSTSSEEMSPLRYPPCLRLIVTESNCLDVGSLYIVPYTGATIGRDISLNHLVLIPDSDISKMHCTIQYNENEKLYLVTNHSVGIGTLVNGCKLSEPPKKCEPVVVRNYDKLQLGGTTFELHIHPGNQTCDDCEPGIIQAKFQKNNSEISQPAADSSVDKETKRRQEMKKIRKRYGLADAPYVDRVVGYKQGYQDRSEIRRITKGSDNPYQPDEEPASVNRAIPHKNKGHKLLAKLGWKEGQSLGKSQQGITEPIQAEIRSNQAAGLGASCVSHHSLDDVRKAKAMERWTKAQKRFHQLEKSQNENKNMIKGDDRSRSSGKPRNKMNFVQGETETFDLESVDIDQQVYSPAPLDTRVSGSDKEKK